MCIRDSGISIGLLSFSYNFGRLTKRYVTIAALVMVGGLLSSYTRSAIVGVLVSAVFSIYWLNRNRVKSPKKLVIITAILLGIGAIWVNQSGLFRYRLISTGGPTIEGRVPLFITAFNIAKENPLGVGTTKYEEYAEEQYFYVKHLPMSKAVLQTTAHNHLLMILAYYGFPGAIILIVFLAKLIFNRI